MTQQRTTEFLKTAAEIRDWVRGLRSGSKIEDGPRIFAEINTRLDRDLPGLRDEFEKRDNGFRKFTQLQHARSEADPKGPIDSPECIKELEETASFRSEIKPKDREESALFAAWCVVRLQAELGLKNQQQTQNQSAQPKSPEP